jgi:uncharacterized protein DUF6941
MAEQIGATKLNLDYTIFCEDIRLEINHRLSLMGLFYAIQVPQLPITLLKLVILNHWSGEGQYLSEVRILTPDRSQPIAVSQPSPFQVPLDGYADNVTMFANITFPAAGNYVVQALINSNLFAEQKLVVSDINQQSPDVSTETIQ